MCSGSVGTSPGLARDERVASLIETRNGLQLKINVVQTAINTGKQVLDDLTLRLKHEHEWMAAQQIRLGKLKGEMTGVERQLKEAL